MKLFVVIGLLIFISCDVSKQIINTKEISISLSKIECGSYEVKNSGKLIGYVVKPFYVEAEKKEDHIIQTENLIKANYSNYYDRFYRAYWFIKNSKGDTTLDIVMLSTKQVGAIPNWQCEEQDVDTYKRNRRNLFDVKHPQFITYNCSKGRFKVLGDPD